MKKNDNIFDDYLKANRRGSRLGEQENQTGWTSKHKVHRSKKTYTRKVKYKKDLFDEV